MATETISKLLELADSKQYAKAIRYFEQNHKRLKISGFSSMEKAPRKLLVNTTRTNRKFKQALLGSFATTILLDTDVDLSLSTDELCDMVSKEQWIGLVAALLFEETEEYTAKALELINRYIAEKESVEAIPVVQNEVKSDKKEEKFRDKYLKARNDLAEMADELNQYKVQFQDSVEEINRLKEKQKDLEQQNIAYLTQLDLLNKEISQLRLDLEKAKEEAIALVPVQQTKANIRVAAPYCNDILCKYVEALDIEFRGIGNLNADDIFARYDEIWVFSDVVPFREYRALRKWKKDSGDSVKMFQTVAELLEYANKVTSNR